MNINGKNAIVIAGSAAGAGAIIFGITKLTGMIKNRKAPKKVEEKAEVEETEE